MHHPMPGAGQLTFLIPCRSCIPFGNISSLARAIPFLKYPSAHRGFSVPDELLCLDIPYSTPTSLLSTAKQPPNTPRHRATTPSHANATGGFRIRRSQVAAQNRRHGPSKTMCHTAPSTAGLTARGSHNVALDCRLWTVTVDDGVCRTWLPTWTTWPTTSPTWLGQPSLARFVNV